LLIRRIGVYIVCLKKLFVYRLLTLNLLLCMEYDSESEHTEYNELKGVLVRVITDFVGLYLCMIAFQ